MNPSNPILPEPVNPEEAFKLLKSEPFDFRKVFRGVDSADYDLISSPGRIRKGEKEGIVNGEREAFDYFMRHAQSIINTPPPVEDLTSWMIIMQHYGAPTRLLDWTRSPFVALYFAYKTCITSPSDKVRIWILSETGCMNHYREYTTQDVVGRSVWSKETLKLFYSDEYENNIVQHVLHSQNESMPYLLYPRKPDRRMNNQQGVLTICPSEYADIEFPLEYIRRPFPSTSTGGKLEYMSQTTKSNILWRLDLPKDWRKDVLKKLDDMGINEASMFPDLEGLGRYTKTLIGA